jgi:pSer/pThr/pTyr-binding forkhead associated (FHA) protein
MNVPFFSNQRLGRDGATTNLAGIPGTGQFSSPSAAPAKDPSAELYIWRIVFQELGTFTEIAASVRNPVVIGRADPATGSTPEIDLNAFGGQESGVSRIHAIIIPTDEGLCVIDLDTPNGTSINGQRLVSGRRYRLRSGDRLELGSLKLMVADMGIVPRGRTAHSTITMNRKAGE